MAQPDWNPAHYARFADQRLQPALDLLARLGDVPGGDVIDLGCGNGGVGPALAARFGAGRLRGVDNSRAMLDQAAQPGAYAALDLADIAEWTPEQPPAVIFSNAALHWLPGHDVLLPALAGALAPGGVLAVQMPHQNRAPSHRLWYDLAEQLWPGRIDPGLSPGCMEPAEYHRILSPLGDFALWETEYFQQLAPWGDGHPVRQFTSSTFARPILAELTPDEQAQLFAQYDAAMARAYPLLADGSALFPFRRLFFTLIPS